jgi:regulator of replication initiation timing
MTTGTDIVVSIAQVAAGGTIVQAMVAIFRRRGELRQLDRQTESVAIDTADQVVTMLRTELIDAREENGRLKLERAGLQRRIEVLTEEVSNTRAELATTRAELLAARAGPARKRDRRK